MIRNYFGQHYGKFMELKRQTHISNSKFITDYEDLFKSKLSFERLLCAGMNVGSLVQDNEDELPIQGHQVLDPLRRQPNKKKHYYFLAIQVFASSF